jgi:tripartite ATP-independent transporter DctP family solute receptor
VNLKLSCRGICVLGTAAVLFGTAGAGAAEARTDGASHAKSTIVIKMAMTNATTSPWVVALQTVSRIIDTKTNGQVQLQVFPNGQLGSQTQILSELKTNTVQMYMQNPPVTSSLDPQIGIFSAPYLLKSPKAVLNAWKSRLGQQIAAHFDQTTGIRLLTPWQIGGWQMMTTSKAIRSCSDLSGLKLRVPPSPVLSAFMQQCGATAVSMTFGEVYLALKTGVIDGMPQVWGNVPGSNLEQVVHSATVLDAIYDFFNPMINDQTWSALTPAQRRIVVSAFGTGRVISDRLVDQTSGAGQQLIKKAGGQIIAPTKGQLATWVHAGDRVITQFASQWGGIARIHALAKAGNTPPKKK